MAQTEFCIRYANSLDCRLFLASDMQNHWTVGCFGHQICKFIGLSAVFGVRLAKPLDFLKRNKDFQRKTCISLSKTIVVEQGGGVLWLAPLEGSVAPAWNNSRVFSTSKGVMLGIRSAEPSTAGANASTHEQKTDAVCNFSSTKIKNDQGITKERPKQN